MKETMPSIIADPRLDNIERIETKGCMKTSTTDHIQENDTGEVHHRTNDTHLLRMVNHKKDTHAAQSARVLILPVR